MKRLAFHRDFRGFTGGHLKVWNYYCHTKSAEGIQPTVYFTDNSRLDGSNPWTAADELIAPKWEPDRADALFLGGMDWLAVPDHCVTPVINLVQGVRHADPEDPCYDFLSRRAVRICVSQPVADAILATRRVNGPVVTIPAGLDYDSFPAAAAERDIAVLIAGLKQPALARELSARLTNEGLPNTCLTSALPRQDFLGLLGRAKVTVFLPLPKEGFYLPALEGMAMGTLIVCPDCVGNRQFCEAEANCLMPDYDLESLASTVLQSVIMETPDLMRLVGEGYKRPASHALSKERENFFELLQTIEPFGNT